MRVWTVGHGTRPAAELIETLAAADVETLVDVRRRPGSRRNPQFDRDALDTALTAACIDYVHAPALGGLRAGIDGEERFGCLRAAAFASYAAWMCSAEWQQAIGEVLSSPAPCLMCAETSPRRCHRRLIADLLSARGHEVLHLTDPGEAHPHRLTRGAELRDGRLFLCGEPVGSDTYP
jgi:uncharacterized protein (DUF488 family)